MKVCPVCGMQVDDQHMLCPRDRTLLLMDDGQDSDYEPETVLVFLPLLETAPDDGPSELFDPDPLEVLDPDPPEAFEPDSWTGAWFAEGEQAEQELAAVTPSDPLPEVYSRALEAADSSMRLYRVPWAIGVGLAGFAVVMLTLL
jgi:hypothetical protein